MKFATLLVLTIQVNANKKKCKKMKLSKLLQIQSALVGVPCMASDVISDLDESALQ
jgi:hypothetical protein